MTRESEPVMGEALRLFVFLFPFLGPERWAPRGPGRWNGEGRARRGETEWWGWDSRVGKRGIPSMVAKRMMGYRGVPEGA